MELDHGTTERRRIIVSGVVQGVGFRPFVHRLASERGLGGFALNDGRGVVVEVEGDSEALRDFTDALSEQAPTLASVEAVESAPVDARGERDFRIEPSTVGPASALIPPDVATCDDCLRELRDPADRRHRYPFINCTQCGPRFTIVRDAPYDRANTTMAGFEMCEACRAEYEDPADRRFHAEPIACPDCGPRLSMPLEDAVELLLEGAIVAVKGLGGYHLACDATDERAVARLRALKHREEKPFALMTAQPDAIAETHRRGPRAARLAGKPDRPPVATTGSGPLTVADSVAPGSPWLGVILPYTPLHHLLCADVGRPLVMTSGNRSDEPIATGDDEARSASATSPTPSSPTTARSTAAARTRSHGPPRRHSRFEGPGDGAPGAIGPTPRD